MKSLVHWITDLVFPAQCLGCRSYGSALCQACLTGIPKRHQQECIVCKRSRRDGTPCTTCESNTMIDQLLIAGHADEPLLAKAISHLKYSHVHSLAGPLSEYIFSALSSHHAIDLTFTRNPLLVPVPLHPRRQAQRGFNQSKLIAQQLAGKIGMVCVDKTLARIRHTTSQVKTGSRWERLNNIKDAFICPDSSLVQDHDIVLVDDVCTTGATLDACAHALKSAGANHVSAIVVARG